MRKSYLVAVTALTMAVVPLSASAQERQSVPFEKFKTLVDLLVSKGSISQQQADALIADSATPASPAVEVAQAPPSPTSGTAAAQGIGRRPIDDPPLASVAAATPQRQGRRPSYSAPPAATAEAIQRAKDSGTVSVDWSEGAPRFTSPGGFTFRPRGRALMDVQSTGGSRFADRNITTTGARGIRIGFEGTFGPHLFYQAEADFSDGTSEIQSAYVGWRTKLRDDITTEFNFGSRLLERAVEGSTSSDQIPFMERNAVALAMSPVAGSFGVGLTSKTFGPGWHVTAQVVGEPVNGDAGSDDTLTLLARGHVNPLRTDRLTLHVGGWTYHERFSNSLDALQINLRVANRFNDNLRIASGPLGDPRSSLAYGGELGLISEGRWVFGEYGRRSIRSDAVASPIALSAWSLSGGWMLTGEDAPYSRRGGVFATPNVRHPVNDGGWGAIGALARYEGTDFTDAPLGGTSKALTLGANWYLNNIAQVMVNYIHSTTNNRTGDYQGRDTADTISTRFQVSF